jgi:anthranilate/para-aminobenzoate synthase component II
MKQDILIINICKERLHYYEFVMPICDILDNCGMKYFVKSYKEINRKDLDRCDRVIICGTSLFDNEFIEDYQKFSWICNFNKPLLGICGGMQIIGKLSGGKILKNTEIGFYKERFDLNFLGLAGEEEVYHLHNYYINFSSIGEFEIYCKNDKVVQAVKDKEKPIFGVLFHPEVRQKELIVNFCRV